MVEPDRMLRMIKNDFGFSEFIFSIGLEENDKTVYWQWVNNNKTKIEAKYKIEMRKTNGIVGTHFVLADANNNLLFDSYSFNNYDYKPSGRYHLYSYWS